VFLRREATAQGDVTTFQTNKKKAAMMDSLGSSGPDRSGVAAPSKRETEENRREGHSRKKCKCDPPGGRSGLGVCRWGVEGWMDGWMDMLESCRARRRDNNRKGIQGFQGEESWQELFLFCSPALGQPYEQVESAGGATGDGERRMARMAPSCW